MSESHASILEQIRPMNNPAAKQDHLYMIIEKLDARAPDISIIKPAMIDRVIFVQDLEDLNRLYALLVLGKGNLAALVRAGSFNLNPAHPGRIALDYFRNWLDKHGIVRRELQFAESGAYERIIVQSVVRRGDFTSREDQEVIKLFDSWNKSHQ